MKKNKVYSLIAASAAALLALSACASGDTGADGDKLESISFTTGAEEYAGYNNLLSSTYSTGNSVVNDRLMMGFGYFDAEGVWQHGTELGDYEKLSDDPLTVKYTVDEDAVYEGGTPMTCEDFYMDWVAQNPKWIRDAQQAAGNVDEDGNGLPLFDHISGSDTYAYPVPKGPECNAGDREFTITFTAPNPDWELIIGGVLPSHVMAKKLDMTKEELFQALKDENFEVAQKLADNWNNWYSKTPGVVPSAEEAPSFGPFRYKADGWKAGEYITLERNPDWWGEPAGVDELVFRMIAPEGQLQALDNQDVNVIEPQATQDSLESLEKMDGVKVLRGSTMIWEHLDFNFGEGSVFAEGAGGKALREAFALCVPRQEIVDKLIKPLDPEAEVMNAREYFSFNDDYKEVVNFAYDGRYDQVDIEAAKAKIAESGVDKPVVRLGYSAPNQRRADQVALIKASCDQAGFEIKDAGSSEFFAPGGGLDTGNYDVALFAWSGSGQVVSGQNIYSSKGQQNYHSWNSPVIDEEWNKVATSLDPKVWLEAKKVIEKELWNELFNIPVFAHPGIVAHTDGLKNVERNVTQSGVVWNAEKWTW
ncbi:MAG: ABC transporter substrate-binding protein [Trueperella sp.]|nr:ABC transporter substrate-binding protein [Trueperella sp.]